jgi:hypothetical protein
MNIIILRISECLVSGNGVFQLLLLLMPSAGMHISILFKGCTPTCVLYVLELEDKPIRVPANVLLGKGGTV